MVFSEAVAFGNEDDPISGLLETLSELAGAPARPRWHRGSGRLAGLSLDLAGSTFELAWIERPTPGKVHEVAARLAASTTPGAIPLVASPFLSPASQKMLDRAGISWVDLSGNARIVTPGLRIFVTGRPDRFRRSGRPPNVFAPKSARVARWMLSHLGESISQREIARETGLSEGYVSRIVARLVDGAFLERTKEGGLRTKHPGVMLDAWREAYDFSKHTIVKGHVAARTGEALSRLVAQAFSGSLVGHAATGLAAAWEMTRFAAFRTSTFYVSSPLHARSLLAPLGFREDERGANLWIVLPNDEGVFQGAEVVGGIRCVSPLQVFLDLKAQPERAQEAADHLRSELLTWGIDD